MALLAALAALAAPAAAVDLTPQERAGKRIYLQGESASGGEISALIGRDDLALPATSMPCGSCHGEDGLGRAEGGARPPTIIWSELVKPYGHVHPGGRKHPRYDASSFARSVKEGLDPAGNALDPTMPRYRMSAGDLASLAAYLRRLEEDRDPGVGETELRVGTLLPAAGPAAGAGRAMSAALEARLAEVNATGGVNGRRVKLVVEGYDPAGGAAAAVAGARRLLERGQVLAVVSGFFPSAEQEVFALAAKAEVPIVGPFTLFASQPESPNPWVFHLLSGVREQARALAEFAAGRLGPERPPVAVLSPAGPPGAGLADAASAAKVQLARRGFAAIESVAYGPAQLGPSLARDLAAKGVRAVIFLGDDADVARLAEAARVAAWTPDLLLPGALVARAALEVPPALEGHVFLAYPTLPTDEKPDGRARLATLAAHGTSGHRAVVIQADGAAAVLLEALRRTGRRVSRRALVASLEALYELDVGLLPPLTFGPSRRVGALGAYVVAVDLKERTFRPVGGWQGVE
ncbi:ABC transporter substrate-binding protein [Anaeromyxobacter oryzae]|uniref:ABC transporter substrate-binding protein n=1 Tax=Anaeromyxobacter oryzae TaxID=2918170 RepID=A0ABN6MSR1_9BACT|nr:ABC transporter substrate-binding protein [Anaeromyxobacter oryzae]BDG04028.1 ABC transporter substrate-binding protein [Anaeromyxobacter oryzae]